LQVANGQSFGQLHKADPLSATKPEASTAQTDLSAWRLFSFFYEINSGA
jgi:hypothetical protein